MELSQIRYFLDVAKTQHVSQSAARLHLAQPALTKSVHKLEQELGVPLFSHRGRNIVLTHYGRYLQEKLTPLIQALDLIPEELAEMTKTENRTIRMNVSAASEIVTDAVIAYKKNHPEINFHLLQNPEHELFDIEITTERSGESGTDGQNRFCCTEKIFLAVPDIPRFRDRHSVELKEVKQEGFISLFGSRQLRNICDSFCRMAGFEPNIIFESDSPDAVKNMIGANLGIGFWPEFTWGAIRSDNVRLLEISAPVCKRDIAVTFRERKADSSHAERFYRFLCAYFPERQKELNV